MGRYNKLISIFAISLMVLGLTIVASAQGRNRRGNNDNYGRNNSNLDSAIKRLNDSSKRFEDVLDRELDRSRYDESNREDNLNELAERFKDAADDLDDDYQGYRKMNDSVNEARRVLNYGSQLDRALNLSRLTRDSAALQGSWTAIERDLRVVANAYRINYNGTYGRNRSNNRSNNRNRNRGNNRNNRNRKNDYPNNYPNTNNRNNRNNRNSNNRNLRGTIVSLKNKSARFEDRLDNQRDNRNGRRVSGSLEDLSNRFNDAVKDLEDEYDNRRDYNDSNDEIRRVLSLGEQVNREVSRSGVNRNIRNQWNSIEQDLRTLANAYNINYNGRSNRSSYGVGDIIRNLPF